MLFSFLLLLTAYLPFQIALSPFPGVDLASIRLLILILFLFWLAKGLKDKRINIRPDWQTACIIIFLFLNAFSVFFARNSFWAQRKLLFLFSVFPVYFVAADILNTKDRIRRASAFLVASGALVAAIGVFQFIIQFFVGLDALYGFWAHYVSDIFLGGTFSQTVLEYPSWLVNVSGETYFRAISVFPDPHMLAFFLGIILPIAGGLFLEKREIKWLFAFGLILLADILTFSRGAYLGLFSAIIFLFLFSWHRFSKKYKVGFILGALVLITTLIMPNPISSRFFSSFNLREGSNAGRIEMWRAAERSISENPLLGVGIGNFPLEIKPLATYREPIYAHNTYLDVAAEAGIIAALAWIGMLFFSAKAFLRKARKDKFYLGPFFGLLIFAVHSMVETGLYSPVVLTLLLLILSFSGESKNNESLS